MADHAPQTIYEWIQRHARRDGAVPAVQALNAPDLSYQGVVAQIQTVVDALWAWGIGNGDRVMVQLPNGPESFVLMHGVSASAVVVMVDPRAAESQLDYLLGFIQPKALIVQRGVDSSGRARAQAAGVRVVEIVPTPEAGAGSFAFADSPPLSATAPGLNGPDDLAFLIATSGTTALPKVVPKTQNEIIQGIDDLLELQRLALNESPPLVALNYLPMHLAYGIWIGSAALITGGRVACMPGLDPTRYFEWMDTYRPTFLAGPPAILEPLLALAPKYPDILARHSLRYIHTGSTTVTEATRADINRIFGVPIVQTYGLTEVGVISQVVLPAGSVDPVTSLGRPEPPGSARVMDADGSFLPPGEPGEIVIRSDEFRGYWNNPEADEQAFFDGWFRTGDEGLIDQDGSLFLLGRLKEVINSGGAKVSPTEVEAILKQHPQVVDAAVFGIRHPEIGETVAAAVVGSVTERELRKFASERLPFYKVPTRIVVVDQIPLNATGKVQRNRLAELLGLT